MNDLDFPGLTDVHAHPALQMWLWGRNLERHYWSGQHANPIASLTDFPMLRKGGVKVLWSALHVPERQYMDCGLLSTIARVFPGGKMLLTKDAWTCLEDQRRKFEDQVDDAKGMRIVRSNAELDAARAADDLAIVHTLEGAHHLAGGLADDDLDGRLARIDQLADWGVASVTIAHLFPNDSAGHTEGIPDSHRKGVLGRFCPLYTQVDLDVGLSAVGEAVVDRLVERRIVPDVTHCTPKARRRVYEVVANRIPVVATHIGVHSMNPVPYNLEEADVRAIQESGGVVGVIFMPYWLEAWHPKPGLDAIWMTMKRLSEWSGGSWEHVAIGTDFDGFTDPPDDVRDASKLPVVAKMLARNGLSDADAKKVLGANARRVLRDGWR